MAYNFYSDIENWSKAKSEWDKANQAGDEKGKYNAHAKAQVYAENLRNNGYGTIADEFTNSNYQQSLDLLKKYESQKVKNTDYSPESDVANIYNAKATWDNYNQSGNIEDRDLTAAKAQAYYENLRNNGYGALADELAGSSYADAKAINDKWAKMGKSSTRDYMYTLGQKYGLSTSDIDKLISWDNGEVIFGGKKIGTPDSVVDGVSYWNDTSILDDAFNDYISRTGTYRSKDVAVNQENEDLFSKYRGAYDYAMNTNPFTTDEARAILGKYDLAGLNARDNAVASGGASNGGNIDSYAAANAMRQQASLVNMGQTAVLDAHQQKIDNIRGILSDMGVNIDRVFKQDETTKAREYDQMDRDRYYDLDKDKWEYEKVDKDRYYDLDIREQDYAEKEGDRRYDFDVQQHNDNSALENRKQDLEERKQNYYETDTTDRREYDQTFNDKKFASDEEQRKWENGQNEILNNTAILETIAKVTGQQPVQWVLQNDAFLSGFVDKDGKLKEEYKDTDFQSLINYAKARGDQETADKYAILRGLKMSQYFDEYGRYAAEGDIAYIKPGETADVYLTKYQSDNALAMTKDTNEANVQINKQDNETVTKVAEMDNSAAKIIAEIEAAHKKYDTDKAAELEKYVANLEANTKKYQTDAENKKITEEQLAAATTAGKALGSLETLLSQMGENNDGPKNYIMNVLVPEYQKAYENFGAVPQDAIILSIKQNTNKHNIDKDEAKLICGALGVDTKWLDAYEDVTEKDKIVDENGKMIKEGQYYGMKPKGYVWDSASLKFVKATK